MKKCPFCGTINHHNGDYCRSCRRTFDGSVPEDMTAEPTRLDLSKDEWRNPLYAAGLSFVGIGLGQFYNGETVKGILALAGVLGLPLLLPLWTTIDPFIPVILVWTLAILDAYLSARKINRLQKTFRHKSLLFWPETACLILIAAFILAAAAAPQVAAKSVSVAAGVVADTKYPAYAVPLYESAILLSPNDTAIRLEKVKVLHYMGRDTEARSDLSYAIATDPNDTAPLMMTGNLLYDNGEYQASINYFEKALKLKPKEAAIWMRKGDAQLMIAVSEMKKMREQYKTLTTGSYTTDSANTAPANIDAFESMQSYRDAMTAYNEAIKLDPLVSVEISAHVLASTQTMVEMYQGILTDMGSPSAPTTTAA